MRRDGRSGERFNCHLPSASFGHYAALSFIVGGVVQRREDRRQQACRYPLLVIRYTDDLSS